MTTSDISGSIVTTGTRVFFVPRLVSLPPLRWVPWQQSFTVLGENDDDRALSLTLRETISSIPYIGTDSTPQVTTSIPCCALYGVVPIGPNTSVLLYVTASERVGSLSYPESHEVFVVKQFSWMRLPARVAPLTENGVSVREDEEEEDYEDDKNNTTGAFVKENSRQLPDSTILEYCAVIDQFCAQSQRHDGGSYFYYSPTVNLALDPSELFGSTRSFPRRLSSSVEPTAVSSRLVFQWNAPLLDAFETDENSSPRRSEEAGALRFANDPYVPPFIRGLVSMAPTDGVDLMLINRLSFRWSGTRYNRRGLDSTGSGITANFAITTLWVLPKKNSGGGEAQHGGNNHTLPSNSSRVATFQIVRGSIPRRWSQPASLSLKPKITILSAATAAEEFASHLNALQMSVSGLSTIHCLDTTSLSRHERHLSDAFDVAIRKWRESETKQRHFPDVMYTKYNVKERMSRGLSYNEMKKEINILLGVDETDSETNRVDFSQWSTEPCDPLSNSGCEGNPRSWHRKHQQGHFIRVNCLDCLDRTNLAQSMIALGVLPRMIRFVCGCDIEPFHSNDVMRKDKAGAVDYIADIKKTTVSLQGSHGEEESKVYADAERVCKELWAQQGIALSKLYAGSDPHFLGFLLGGNSRFKDQSQEALLALSRWWQQNFYDGNKQDAISLITRQHDPELFNSKLESPFGRRLSGMNKMVALGLLFAFIAVGVNLVLMFLYPSYRLRKEFLCCVFFWAAYLIVLLSHIKKDAISYTNYPLLT